MLNRYVKPARTIARGLGETETAAKDALRSTAALILIAIEARDEVGGSLDLGRAALVNLGEAAAHAAKAYDYAISAHAAFAADRDKVGLTPRTAGCGSGSSDQPMATSLSAIAG